MTPFNNMSNPFEWTSVSLFSHSLFDIWHTTRVVDPHVLKMDDGTDISAAVDGMFFGECMTGKQQCSVAPDSHPTQVLSSLPCVSS